jgi:hypothetical protein
MEKRDWELINECIKMLESTLSHDMAGETADEIVKSVAAILKVIIKTGTAKWPLYK